MKNYHIVLSDADRQILQSTIAIAEGMSDFFSNSCEVVIHSLEDLDHSVIKIINGQHSGRQKGSPITDATLAILQRMLAEPGLNYVTYFTKNRKGEQVKASTSAIFGENHRIIGLFCINFFLSTPLCELMQMMLPGTSETHDLHLPETFASDSEEVILASLEEIKQQVYTNGTILPSNRNKEIVNLLYQRGNKKIKNAVPFVGEQLGISKNTVYLHLRNLQKKS